MKQLTKLQNRVLAMLSDLLEELGKSPTHQELAKFLSLTPSTIRSHLNTLERLGYITRSQGKKRALRLTTVEERYQFSLKDSRVLLVSCEGYEEAIYDGVIIYVNDHQAAVCTKTGSIVHLKLPDPRRLVVDGESWVGKDDNGTITITPCYPRQQASF